MANFLIKQYDFSDSGKNELSLSDKGKNWPVVYLIHNNTDMYIGETSSAYYRMEQHLKNKARKNLKKIEIIFDSEFNKSAILDIEQSLIQLASADGKFKLQNLNGGQSEKHNYYERERYINKISFIWQELQNKGLANKSYEDIKNSDIFKYSPYNTLTSEQSEVAFSIITNMLLSLENKKQGLSIIKGSVGTGKTILLINILFKIISAQNTYYDDSDNEDDLTNALKIIHDIRQYVKTNKQIKIGFVVPMTSLRQTMKKVFHTIGNGLSASMVIGPQDVVKDTYDVLIVDEAHRLLRRKNLTAYGSFDDICKKLDLDPMTATQLDFIIKSSKYQILVYDNKQTVKGSDLTDEQFNMAINPFINNTYTYYLTTQMRCEGGSTYISYVEDILNCQVEQKQTVIDYDFKLFADVEQMINRIKELDKVYGLCRVAAGYSWKWISKNCKSYAEAVSKKLYDIDICDHKYIWNMTNKEFIISKNAINEIGCIHTLQGYDLNYIGVIFGKEIDYDIKNDRIIINRNNFYDTKVASGIDDKTLKEYIINSYKVIMTRGIKGCYVYVYNNNLRDYLSKFIDEYKN